MSGWLDTLRSWKTTVSATIAAAAGFVLFSPNLFVRWPWLTEISKYIMAGGLVSLGLAAKDANMTGGTKAQDDRAGGPPPKGAV